MDLDESLNSVIMAMVLCEQRKTTVPIFCSRCYVEWIGKTSVMLSPACPDHKVIIEMKMG